MESVAWRASKPRTLEVVLIQWQGRDRVTGEVWVEPGYSTDESDAIISGYDAGSVAAETARSDGQLASLTLSDILRVDINTQAFDFRFFQKIEMSMPSPISYSETGNMHLPPPDYVEVQLVSVGNDANTVKTQIPWKDISE